MRDAEAEVRLEMSNRDKSHLIGEAKQETDAHPREGSLFGKTEDLPSQTEPKKRGKEPPAPPVNEGTRELAHPKPNAKPFVPSYRKEQHHLQEAKAIEKPFSP